jgi:hypothetical protein
MLSRVRVDGSGTPEALLSEILSNPESLDAVKTTLLDSSTKTPSSPAHPQ